MDVSGRVTRQSAGTGDATGEGEVLRAGDGSSLRLSEADDVGRELKTERISESD
jgi:hypothetical protein